MNTLERHVLEIIGENTISPDVFLDTTAGLEPIRDSLNDAIEEITMITGSYKRTYYIPLTKDQSFYRLKMTDGAFGWVTDAWVVNQHRRLEQTDIISLSANSPTWMDDAGTPHLYYQIGRNIIGFYRKPTADDDMIELTCVVVPNRYETSEDRVKIRDNYKWAAVHYAVSEYWISRGDAKEAVFWFNKYLENMNLDRFAPQSNERVYTLGGQ